jgi:hypothetical protein
MDDFPTPRKLREDVSEQEDLWESLEIDGRMLFGVMPQIFYRYLTGRRQQERQEVGGR